MDCLWMNNGDTEWVALCSESSYTEKEKGEVDDLSECPFCQRHIVTTRPISYYEDMEVEEDTRKPVPMTLEEIIIALGKQDMVLQAEPGYGDDQEDFLYKVMRYSSEEKRYVLECCYFSDPYEAATDALGMRIVPRDDAAELRAALKALLDPEGHDPAYDPTFGPGEPSKQAVNRARAALAATEV